MELTVLSSGSKGNATLIGTPAGAVLIDMGLSFKELSRRLEQSGQEAASIRAVFVTHEHSDHIRGVGVLARKLRIPVYISPRTLAAAPRNLFRGDEEIRLLKGRAVVDQLTVTSLPISHDVVDPIAYLICNGDRRVGVITDLGFPTQAVKHELGSLDAVVIESNHCPEMLEKGPYPWFLKQRISGRRGHLSNLQTGELLREHLSDRTKLVYLAHLSEENNDPELALATVEEYLTERSPVRLEVATQYQASKTEQIYSYKEEK